MDVVASALAARHCENLNNSQKSFSSDYSKSNSRYSNKRQGESDEDAYFTKNNKYNESGSVLHFKQPIPNQKGDILYYDDRGRMEPMNRSELNKKTIDQHVNKFAVHKNFSKE